LLLVLGGILPFDGFIFVTAMTNSDDSWKIFLFKKV